jgi:hypothetical protein
MSIVCFVTILWDTLKKTFLWVGYFIYLIDCLNNWVFVKLTALPHNLRFTCPLWIFNTLFFIRSYWTNSSAIFVNAQGWSQGYIEVEYDGLENDNKLLHNCWYGIVLVREVWKSRFGTVIRLLKGEPKKRGLLILTDEEVKQLLESTKRDSND